MSILVSTSVPSSKYSLAISSIKLIAVQWLSMCCSQSTCISTTTRSGRPRRRCWSGMRAASLRAPTSARRSASRWCSGRCRAACTSGRSRRRTSRRCTTSRRCRCSPSASRALSAATSTSPSPISTRCVYVCATSARSTEHSEQEVAATCATTEDN